MRGYRSVRFSLKIWAEPGKKFKDVPLRKTQKCGWDTPMQACLQTYPSHIFSNKRTRAVFIFPDSALFSYGKSQSRRNPRMRALFHASAPVPPAVRKTPPNRTPLDRHMPHRFTQKSYGNIYCYYESHGISHCASSFSTLASFTHSTKMSVAFCSSSRVGYDGAMRMLLSCGSLPYG